MSDHRDVRAANSWRSHDWEFVDKNETNMTSRELDDLQSCVLFTESEVRRLLEQLGRGNRYINPEHLCAIMLQLRSYEVRLYDLARLLESNEESMRVKKTIKRRKRRPRAYKK